MSKGKKYDQTVVVDHQVTNIMNSIRDDSYVFFAVIKRCGHGVVSGRFVSLFRLTGNLQSSSLHSYGVTFSGAVRAL